MRPPQARAVQGGTAVPRSVLLRARSRASIARMTTWGSVAVLLVIVVVSAPLFIAPPCPKKIVIATGSRDGAYFEFGNKYRAHLVADGIQLEVHETAGSVANLSLLAAADSNVSLAIVQGGVSIPSAEEQVESLASLYLEPVWLFYRSDIPNRGASQSKPAHFEVISDLKGLRVAIGAAGSGTRAIATALLGEHGLVHPDGTGDSIETRPLSSRDAAEALKRGDIDAAFFVVSPKAPLVKELLEAPGIELMSFRLADAYRRRFPYLTSVTLSEGTLDLDQNLPSRDVVLLAPTANLVARSDLHPALVPLLLSAAVAVHEPGGLLEEPGAFPSTLHTDFPLHPQARRYFKSGPSIFYKYLPFALAVWLDRVKLMLLPLCTLLFPFAKAFPPIYRWRIRSKIYRWYRVLREIDQKLMEMESFDVAADIERLAHLEAELGSVSVPLSYMEEFYNLRMHVEFVRNRLQQLNAQYAELSCRAA